MYIRKNANKEKKKKKKKINVVSGLFQSFLARNCISSARNSIECKSREKVNEKRRERKREITRDRGKKGCKFVRPRAKIPFGAVNNLRTESNFAGENERKERERMKEGKD